MFFFFFKQKTAYEMRISDWSSDVCSSDLLRRVRGRPDPDADPRRHGGRTFEREAARQEAQAVGSPAEGVAPHVRHRRLFDQRSRRGVLDIAANRVSDAWTPIFRACGKAGEILPRPRLGVRSDERRVGKECGSTWRTRWWSQT